MEAMSKVGIVVGPCASMVSIRTEVVGYAWYAVSQ